jgi:hypothetical protein
MCAANSIVERGDAGNRKLSKKRSSGRIDGMIVLTMAIGAASAAWSTKVDIEALMAEPIEASGPMSCRQPEPHAFGFAFGADATVVTFRGKSQRRSRRPIRARYTAAANSVAVHAYSSFKGDSAYDRGIRSARGRRKRKGRPGPTR